MRLVALLLALLVVSPAMGQRRQAASVEASQPYRITALSAKTLTVFEGLPHQMWEKEQLATEIKRKDTRQIWDFPFYTPGVEARNAEQLRALLGSRDSIEVYGGPKLCGGYHPDYCISWQAGEAVYSALICFGCTEIVFYDGKNPLFYELSPAAARRYKELLSPYEAKRPRRKP